MKEIIKNILILLGGIVVGGLVNMAIVMVSGSIIPPPEGADLTTMEGLEKSMHLFRPIHFLMPFLAHALGTLTGAALTSYFIKRDALKWALTVGAFFLLGGIANATMLPSPLWFNVVDLGLAYLPMAYIGWKLTDR